MIIAFWILFGVCISGISFCIIGIIKPVMRNSKIACWLSDHDNGVYLLIWIIVGISFAIVIGLGITWLIYHNGDNFYSVDIQQEVTNINNRTGLNIQTYEELEEYYNIQSNKGEQFFKIIAPIGILFWIIEIFIESLLFPIDRQLMKIKQSINKLSESPSLENKRLIALLKKTQNELERQKELKNLQEGIRIVKRAKVNQSLNIQKDLDELQALCQLNETTLLEEKYK